MDTTDVPPRRAPRWILAIAASAAVVVFSPFAGEARAWLREALPGRYAFVINTGIAALVLVAVAWAIRHIRERRAARFGAIAAAGLVAIASASLTATASGSVNAVERFHFVEYGVLAWLFYRAVEGDGSRVAQTDPSPSRVIGPAIACLLVGIADEWFQWFVPERVGEWRDVFLNGTAIVAGLLFSVGLEPPDTAGPALPRRARSGVWLGLAALVLAMAAFLQTVHLGHVVRDPEAGAFRSRYDAAELQAASRERAAAWAVDPPPMTTVRLSREDQYLAEGIWHVRARNAAWDTDVATSWRENLILETWFAPVLDTPSYLAPVSRWPDAQREDARSRAAGRPGGWMSSAEPLRIIVWPGPLFWAAALAAAAALVILGVAPRRSA
jgi:hypothetical protein